MPFSGWGAVLPALVSYFSSLIRFYVYGVIQCAVCDQKVLDDSCQSGIQNIPNLENAS
jgi:hypothetical protein